MKKATMQELTYPRCKLVRLTQKGMNAWHHPLVRFSCCTVSLCINYQHLRPDVLLVVNTSIPAPVRQV